jgi:hypothetical protein
LTRPGALSERYSIKQQHGANFDSPQTLKQIIDNLFATVSGAQAAAVAGKLMARYGYDPR